MTRHARNARRYANALLNNELYHFIELCKSSTIQDRSPVEGFIKMMTMMFFRRDFRP